MFAVRPLLSNNRIQFLHQLPLGTRGFFLAGDEELRWPSAADTSRHFLRMQN